MNAKLTLTIEKSVIEKAKLYAKNSGRSLSDLIESYLARLVAEPDEASGEASEKLSALFGSVDLSHIQDDRTAIREVWRQKYQE